MAAPVVGEQGDHPPPERGPLPVVRRHPPRSRMGEDESGGHSPRKPPAMSSSKSSRRFASESSIDAVVFRTHFTHFPSPDPLPVSSSRCSSEAGTSSLRFPRPKGRPRRRKSRAMGSGKMPGSPSTMPRRTPSGCHVMRHTSSGPARAGAVEAQPGGHGGGGVEIPQTGAVEVSNQAADLGCSRS